MTRPKLLPMVLPLLLALPAHAGAVPPPPDALRREALDRVHRARELIAAGGLAGAVRAASDLVGLTSRLPRAVSGRPPAGTPAAIAPEVGRLAAEVRLAGTRVLDALRVAPAELTSLMAEGDRALAAVSTLPGETPDPAAERRLDLVSARLAVAVDVPAVHAAALGLATAIDETLPGLRTYAASLPAEGAAVPCDVAQQGPVCIGGTGSSTYTTDYALVVDLGGDDIHANSAGGGWLGNPGSVTIDVGGNDRYETTVPTPAGAFAVQGAGVLGVGVLVDAAGNDVYAADAPTKSGGVYAQGVGGGAGVGILADLVGNDAYALTNILAGATPGVFSMAAPAGQGVGDTGGVGIVLDREGNDTYLIDAGSCGGCHVQPVGFGYGETAGVGLHVDGGGSDQMTLRAVAADIAPEVSDPPSGLAVEINPYGYGWGIAGGAGVDLSGPGPTSRSLLGRNGAPAGFGVEVRGFGHADLGSFGAVSDAGGDDVYLAQAYSQDIRHLSVDDSCACDGVLASALADQASVIGMAYSQLGARALLEDAGGNDQYISRASSYAEAVARDDRTAIPPSGPYEEDQGAQAEAAVAYNNFSIVQGAAGQGGASFLVDAAGDDLYVSEAGGEAVARASAHLEEATVTATANAPGGYSTSQGYGGLGGYAELRDLGGTDTYRSLSTSSATTEPAGGATAGNPVAAVQGDGTGWLLDIGGTADVFVSTPTNPACTGTRGGELWLDCSNTGGGINR